MWDDDKYHVSIFTSNNAFIHAKVGLDSTAFAHIVVYGPPNLHRRKKFYIDLVGEMSKINGPCLIGRFQLYFVSIGTNGWIWSSTWRFYYFSGVD